MKRLWVCVALLAFAVSVCVCARVGLNRVAQEETRLLLLAGQAVKAGEPAAIDAALSSCEAFWQEKSRPFYLYVNHNFFNQYEYTLLHLRDYAALDPGLALEGIGYCIAVLQDQAQSQRPVLENIF